MFRSSRRRRFAGLLLAWYRSGARKFPWRGVRDPYRVLLSEVMLQQTQAARVASAYPPFLRRFPTLRRLAAAPRSEVVRAWSGMGYNNRAVRLHALARMLVRGHRGAVPRDPEILAALPGIGPYTLAAVRCFAFGERVPVVDVNVRRVLSRVAVPQAGTADLLPEAEVADLAGELLPARGAEEWNQALMDLGARVCTARAPRCDACPVADACVSRTVIRPSSRRRAPAEPSRNGVPDRLTRGRIVETLRALPAGRWIAADPLARRVAPGFCAHERAWFLRLLHALERDGVIRIAPGTSVRVRLA